MILTNSTGVCVVLVPTSLPFSLPKYLYHPSPSLMMLCPKVESYEIFAHSLESPPPSSPTTVAFTASHNSKPNTNSGGRGGGAIFVEDLAMVVTVIGTAIFISTAKFVVAKVTMHPRAESAMLGLLLLATWSRPSNHALLMMAKTLNGAQTPVLSLI